MPLLPFSHLPQHVHAHGMLIEGAIGDIINGDKPGQHQKQAPDKTRQRLQGLQETGRTLDHHQHQHGYADKKRRHRPFDQNARAHGCPENRRKPPAPQLFSRCHIDPRQSTEGGKNGEDQNRIRLGQTRLHAQQDTACHQERRQNSPPSRHENQRRPIGQQHHANGGQKRGQPENKWMCAHPAR